MKNIFLLGSTGSIGVSALDVVSQHSDRFRIRVLVTNRNISLLREQIREFRPDYAIIYDKTAYREFSLTSNAKGTRILHGESGIEEALQSKICDIFVNAFVGFAGLKPTISAIQAGLSVALANKETLVVAGGMITDLVKKYRVSLFPIDSEHSAIWQCIVGEDQNPIKRILLTASGGPFLNKSQKQLELVTPEEALQHPNWDMGPKITIDSATLMNKGLEVIEAFWLYPVDPAQIEVIIHPQSIIHSMVEFEDHSIKAQLGIPDMRIPIQYALSHPARHSLDVQQMDFRMYDSLTFEAPDTTRFPCLSLAYSVLEHGQTYPAVLNAANEVAVDAFLNKKLKFTHISDIIREALDQHKPKQIEDLQDLLEIDRETRQLVLNLIQSKQMH
jgi:1-deoxy-D-xylulose-5-phosphate reductoisomerase